MPHPDNVGCGWCAGTSEIEGVLLVRYLAFLYMVRMQRVQA